MRRLLYLASALLALGFALVVADPPSRAQFVGTQAWTPATSVSYTGPCDTSLVAGGCTLFYGIRAATGTIASANAASFDWSCTNGSTFTGTVHFVSTGGLNTTETATIVSDCGAQVVNITKWYEQISGLANAPFNSGTHPQFVTGTSSCKGLTQCVYFPGGGLLVSASVSIVQPWSIAIVGCSLITTPSSNIWFAAKSGVWAVGFSNAADKLAIYAGSALETVSATDCVSANNQHSFIFVGNNSTAPGVVLDGVANSFAATPGSNGISNNFGIGSDDTNASELDGLINEMAVYSIALNSTQYAAVCHNQFAFWGTSVSC